MNGKDFFGNTYDEKSFKELEKDYIPYRLFKDENNEVYFEVFY